MLYHESRLTLRAFLTLRKLLEEGFAVQLSRDQDGDFSGHAWDGKTRRCAVASTLPGLIDGLTAHPREKPCAGCGKSKRLWAFGPKKDSADGHASTCKACESERVAKLGRARKLRRPPA